MSRAKILSVVIAAMALTGIFTSSAGADVIPPPSKGQPAFSGHFGDPEVVVAHCQALIELFGEVELPPGTYPGGIVLLPSGELKVVDSAARPCPLAEQL